VAGVAVVVVLVLYAGRMAGLVDATRRASRMEARLGSEVAALGTEVDALETQRAVAETEGYAERWAREERGWVQPGDQPFVVAVVTAAPSATPTATPSAGPFDRLQRWLRGDPGPPSDG
jgi:hypothetical protein